VKQQGFSLVELVTVLLIITVLSTIALRSTVDIGYSTRYEQTKDRLNSIKQAIIGNPKRTINGQPDISGFVADMGQLPNNIQELLTQGTQPAYQGKCSNSAHTTQATCINGEAWLFTGWRGPYLSVSDNPANKDAYTDGWGREAQGYCSDPTITVQASCTGSNTWTTAANDFNYGWVFQKNKPGTGDLTLFSYGKDQTSGGTPPDYDADYPATQPIIPSNDWLVDISGGVSIRFIKPYTATQIQTPPTSLCTDPTKTTEVACVSPDTWYGGCSKAGYINKDSCVAASGTWKVCSDGTSTDKNTCESASAIWYGEGYGCNRQRATDKTSCLALTGSPTPKWRGCTDNGTITDQPTCLNSNQIWYGNSLRTLDFPPQSNSYNTQSICLKVFYGNGNSITSVTSSNQLTSLENGSSHTFTFTFPNTTNIPAGINAIGIYKHDGTNCTSILYPSDRTQPIPVLFVPHSNLPIINW